MARHNRDMGYEAVLLVSFGGPERREDVQPFLDNVLRGKSVPEARRQEVAEHYYRFDGRSPLSAANRALQAGLERELAAHGPRLPVYLANRNWHPLLPDVLRQMAADGVGRALAVVTSAFGSYSGCRQYLEDIERARRAAGEGAPQVDKVRLFFNHPDFIAIWAERVRSGLAQAGPGAAVLFTAHSIPLAMAETGPYEAQLREAARLVAEAADARDFQLAYQSRSGPPQQPWLEPSVETALDALAARGVNAVVLAPLGFLADHMEVVYDLDVEAAAHARSLGLRMVRLATPGDHPALPALLRELILERIDTAQRRRASGSLEAWGDVCPEGCCLMPSPSHRATTAAAKQLPNTLTAVRPISRN